jgi:hypothetical protein
VSAYLSRRAVLLTAGRQAEPPNPVNPVIGYTVYIGPRLADKPNLRFTPFKFPTLKLFEALQYVKVFTLDTGWVC